MFFGYNKMEVPPTHFGCFRQGVKVEILGAGEIWNPSITPFTKTWNAKPTDPGSPSENGFMEPKYLSVLEVIEDTPIIIWRSVSQDSYRVITNISLFFLWIFFSPISTKRLGTTVFGATTKTFLAPGLTPFFVQFQRQNTGETDFPQIIADD